MKIIIEEQESFFAGLTNRDQRSTMDEIYYNYLKCVQILLLLTLNWYHVELQWQIVGIVVNLYCFKLVSLCQYDKNDL